MQKLFSRLAILCLFLSMGAHAQLIRRHHAHAEDAPPKAILVQLSTEMNRINYYKKKKGTSDQEMLEADAAAQRAHMIADFKAHFKFCPVYYVYDTNQAAIKVKDFSVLMNSDLQPATNVVISPADTNYFIVFFGYEEATPDKKGDNDIFSSGDSYNSMKTLIALRYDFTQLSHQLPYKAGPVSRLNTKMTSADQALYMYHSQKFDISYEPYAILYSRNLTTYYKKKK